MKDALEQPNASAVEAIFNAALGFPPAERPAYLAGACGNDLLLRQRVEALLRAHGAARGFLPEHPSAGPGAQLSSATAAIAPGAGELAAVAEKPGDRIGRYRLREKIGEGGCGVVYVAEQEEPVRRRVALKVIKLGMDTRQVIARFEAERQARALMDHPNIAKVFDAGATGTGRPYFVMELVRGTGITDYCDQSHSATRERLDLFIKVCQAVQHAHQKGIIHRDLKPSNILVTVNDGVPVPKVIDFGIAKATSGPLTDKTIYTAFQQFLGTPAYMSPEQTAMTGQDIDTRSDIYSLGVLLYELLTGRTPFDTNELLAAGLDEMRRTICDKEPARPSTRLSTMPDQELSATAQRRGLNAPKLVSEMRGELDWIVMKCLDKDRSRRYVTANGLATDIQRHLHNEPVLACPPNNLYRFQKLVRRNKALFIAATAVMLTLVAGLCFSTWALMNEREARRQQEKALTQLNELLKELGAFSAAGLEQTERLKILRKRLPPDDPLLRNALAELAWTLLFSDKPVEAEPFARECLAIQERTGPDDVGKFWVQGLLGDSLLRQKRYAEAEPEAQFNRAK